MRSRGLIESRDKTGDVRPIRVRLGGPIGKRSSTCGGSKGRAAERRDTMTTDRLHEPDSDKWLEKTDAFDVSRGWLIGAIELAMDASGLPFGPAVASVLAKVIPEHKHRR